MKVLIVTHVVSKNEGQGRVNYEVVRAALEVGHTVTVLASVVDEALARRPHITVVLIDESRLPTTLLKYQIFAWRAAAWIRANRHAFDIVQVNGFIAWTRADVNAIHFVHNGWYCSGYYPFRITGGAYDAYQILFTRINAWCEKWSFRHSRVLVAVSEKVGAELVATGFPAQRISVIRNGVDHVEFSPDASKLPHRARFNLPERAFLLLFAGDLRISRKNLDTTLSALTRCAPDVHLVVAGDFCNSRYPAMAKKLKITDRVHFVGLVEDMPTIMRGTDLFVFPSRYEPFGLVLLEALASGLPVITARTAGAAEIIGPDCGIVLDDPDDAYALAEAITHVASFRVRAKEMGEAGRRLATTMSWQAMAGRYLELFDDIATRRGAADTFAKVDRMSETNIL
jgi:glycosyltransferase involved in cell wall biosynthesis